MPVFLIVPFVVPGLLYRRVRFGYAFRKIPLSQGKFAIVDPEDYYELSRYKWYAEKSGGTFYASRNRSSVREKSGGARRMHRYVMKAESNMYVDHINHKGLDNRKANLRPATRAQNSYNSRRLKKTVSGFRGVYPASNSRRWEARIFFKGKKIYLGSFEEVIETAKAYDEAAKKYHGQFAKLNFP